MSLITIAILLALALVFAAIVSGIALRLAIDLTPLEHAAIAVGIQLAWIAGGGDAIAGAAIGTAVFIGREHAQAEARLHRAGLARGDFWDVLRVLRPGVWKMGDVLDFLAPLIFTALIAGAFHAVF